MEVVITGKGPANTIRGLLLQARLGDKIVGKFTLKPSDNFAQLLNCGEPGVSNFTRPLNQMILFPLSIFEST